MKFRKILMKFYLIDKILNRKKTLNFKILKTKKSSKFP
ncbi:hypothetical protein CHAB381_0945 [Campylobacter hominis ATCC BAA-381]|uniref:Uncharacterized protein n=1 Tax=Campylobacter hominis (strain ATCC BAA-381 / DSM 21671 / CCUG 45161 / LMG 19568 / NCTC 13146 / CH001A) TaxID=360107 RepID=A7I1W5_CAMHC|nr:hypothetical protein CHAB381_0945 [Campylobacter hominis ATCC BAA-381]